MRSWVAAILLMIHSLKTMKAFSPAWRAQFGLKRLHAADVRPRTFGSFSGLDTIFALSSGPIAKSGVAVVRISGPASLYCLEQLTPKAGDASKAFTPPEPRKAALRYLYSPVTNDLLDQSLVLWFPGPRSFTGEDVVELHLHGSRAVIKGVFEALAHLDVPSSGKAIRPAARGEFTRRAFDNGKMDLTEVEGLSDLLDAETSGQRKQALKQMDGHLRKQYEAWREVLMKCLAHTEAVIDFGDDDREDDVSDSTLAALVPRVQQLKEELLVHLRDGRRGELVREGIQIALAGPPNAGKSSLMNALARRPAAIVSPIAGTTRDIVEVRLELAGVPCIVSDTAGLRQDSSNVIELEGMRRAREAFERAHIRLFVVDSSDTRSVQEAQGLLRSLVATSGNAIDNDDAAGSDSDSHQYSTHDDKVHSTDSSVMIVYNKMDLKDPHTNECVTGDAATCTDHMLINMQGMSSIVPSYRISCTTGWGLQSLEDALARTVERIISPDGLPKASGSGITEVTTAVGSTMITRERHRRHVKLCVGHLDRFLMGTLPMDAAAEEIRLAMQELGKITGRVDVEELLDIIFRDFCIGK